MFEPLVRINDLVKTYPTPARTRSWADVGMFAGSRLLSSGPFSP